ncbi:MAG: 5-amino-6-(D-ribitylamino)uracil--L-tyrosine 4-hydroxyphenyl transferase CofH [Methanoregula sp.]|nr:5-amino-6-(D-ribitylamino)uracil--L-tyrosine 4-hydroxyphenyl transferase CofH [Methanoregula sp.]
MSDTSKLLSDVLGGHRLTDAEATRLLDAKGREVFQIMSAADEVRARRAGDIVTYVKNQNLHVTNICKNLCGFCGFGRNADDEGAYCYDKAAIQAKVRLALKRSVTEICPLSGVHPDFTVDSYCDLIRWVHEVGPHIHLHAFSPDEVSHAASKSNLPSVEVLLRFKAAGLGSLQGTAAEILVDSVRKVICPRKLDTAEWIRIIREAHKLGIPSTATIMYGTCETAKDRAVHLGILRKIQDETHGFTELVPLSYIHTNTSLYKKGISHAGATGREDLLMISVSRLFLDNFDNIQVPWGKLGIKMSQMMLLAGGNDLAGTMFSDDVTVDAGGFDADYLDPAVMERMASDIGRTLCERTTLYELVR